MSVELLKYPGIVRVLELARDHTPAADVPPEDGPALTACLTNTPPAVALQRFGPGHGFRRLPAGHVEPPPPRKTTKRAEELRPGDWVHGCRVEGVWVFPRTGPPQKVEVSAAGCPAWEYPAGKVVPVCDGPPVVAWDGPQLVLMFEGEKLLALHRMGPTPGGDTPETHMSWQEAAGRMEQLRRQGEPFISQHKLAERLGCSSGTVNKAINRTPSLQAWAKPDADPRAQRLNDVVTDRTAQTRELDPAEEVRIREYLERGDLADGDRAYFNSLPDPKAQLKYLDDLESLAAEQAADRRRRRAFPKP